MHGAVKVLRITAIPTTGREIQLGTQTNWLKIRNLAAVAGQVFFSKDDFDKNVNYVTLPVAAAATPYGEWEGPVALARNIPAPSSGGNPPAVAGAYSLWIKSASSTVDVEIVASNRRT